MCYYCLATSIKIDGERQVFTNIVPLVIQYSRSNLINSNRNVEAPHSATDRTTAVCTPRNSQIATETVSSISMSTSTIPQINNCTDRTHLQPTSTKIIHRQSDGIPSSVSRLQRLAINCPRSHRKDLLPLPRFLLARGRQRSAMAVGVPGSRRTGRLAGNHDASSIWRQ
jgi:hypothetical protein